MEYGTYGLGRVTALEAASVALVGWASGNGGGSRGLSDNVIQQKYKQQEFKRRHTGVTTTVVVIGCVTVPVVVAVTVTVEVETETVVAVTVLVVDLH
jgi:hypothetical protein